MSSFSSSPSLPLSALHDSYQRSRTLNGEPPPFTLPALKPSLGRHEDVPHGGLIVTLLRHQNWSLLIAGPAATRPQITFCHVHYVRAARLPRVAGVVAWKTKTNGQKPWMKTETDMEGERQSTVRPLRGRCT